MAWCRAHLPDVPVTVTDDKARVHGHVLVDDWLPYVERWQRMAGRAGDGSGPTMERACAGPRRSPPRRRPRSRRPSRRAAKLPPGRGRIGDSTPPSASGSGYHRLPRPFRSESEFVDESTRAAITGIAGRLLQSDAVRAGIDPIVERVQRKLAQDRAAAMAWEPIPLSIYGESLPAFIRSSWVFILRAWATTGAEPTRTVISGRCLSVE